MLEQEINMDEKYEETKFDNILRVSDNSIIPKDLDNSDYQIYLKWENNGGVIKKWVEPPPIPPQSVSKLGLIRALREAGIWNQIKTAISSNETTQEDWDAAQEINRKDSLTVSMVSSLQLTENQIDALMIRAVQLVK